MEHKKNFASNLAVVMLVFLVMASIWPHCVHSRAILLMEPTKGHLGPLHPVASLRQTPPASMATHGRVLERLWFKLSSGPSKAGPGH
ncbi:hypothetical protein MRB53_017397 [Persea americana]|uniref:Uncharacterized protein n=1 Tax=Persea americana TaxID=3435 RepID=A0ACC2M522_PERAE|nr:hypothetical protein MRB53_017397 [Persea americana]